MSQRVPTPLHFAPLLPIAAAFTLGIVLDRYLPIGETYSLACAAFGLLAGIVASRRGNSTAPWIFLAIAALGAAHHELQCRHLPSSNVANVLSSKPLLVRARALLVEDWSVRGKTKPNPLISQPREETSVGIVQMLSLQKDGQWAPMEGKVRLTIPGRMDDLHIGDELELFGWMNLPGPAGNPGEWDYPQFLRDDGITAEMHIRKSQDLIVRLAAGDAAFNRLLAKIRAHGQEVLQKNLPDSEYGLAAALLLGINNLLPPSEWDHYVRTGVIHVLAISGQHLVILGFFLRFVMRPIGIGYRSRAVSVAALLFLYALLTGGRPSAMRAAVMVSVACVGVLIGRRAYAANVYCLAWIAVLLLNPADLFSSGFQLSFLAVAVLFWALPMWLPKKPIDPLQLLIEDSEPTLKRWCRFFIRASMAAYATTVLIGLALVPCIMQWQSLISLSGLVIGPPVILLSTIALLAGFALFIDDLLGGFLSPVFTFALSWSLRLANSIVQFGDNLPWGCWYTGPLPIAGGFAFYGILIAWLIWSKWRDQPLPEYLSRLNSGLFLKTLLIVFLIGFIWPARSYLPDELRVDFVSVGHGGCTVLELPDGRVVLYDAGSLAGPDIVQRHIAPYLWHRGIHRIDEVILSHADLDHFNGLPALLERFAIGQITTTPSFSDKNSPGVKEILAVLERRGTRMHTIHTPMAWSVGEIKFEVLHPPAEGPAGVENVRSLILSIEHQGHRILLTGDIEKAGLDMVLVHPSPSYAVLMAPHHGSVSANPPRLLQWAKPSLVVVNNSEAGFTGKIKPVGNEVIWNTGSAGLITIRSHRTGLVAESFLTGERRVLQGGNR